MIDWVYVTLTLLPIPILMLVLFEIVSIVPSAPLQDSLKDALISLTQRVLHATAFGCTLPAFAIFCAGMTLLTSSHDIWCKAYLFEREFVLERDWWMSVAAILAWILMKEKLAVMKHEIN